MKKHQMKYVLTGGLILFAFAFLVINPGVIGLPADAAETMITLFPSIFVIIVSIYGFSDSQGLGRVASMIGLGFGLCYFIGAADTAGLVTVEMLSGLSVYQLQLWIMILSTIGGGVAYAFS